MNKVIIHEKIKVVFDPGFLFLFKHTLVLCLITVVATFLWPFDLKSLLE